MVYVVIKIKNVRALVMASHYWWKLYWPV